ncbi:MAG TPA: cobyric acid synthase, partial [Reyranella sp.]|nr:cobyric acid synthase [Reyranella sp.]
NMSNNAAVTADGGEIGRAQALQARAARVLLSVHMNPVLLKPQSDVGAQVVVQGKVFGNAKAREYQGLKPKLLGAVLDSFGRLAAECDLVLVEGAGSASEVNLRANDIANMGFARAADVPVVLVGDIDRGGVIASLVGTKTVIDVADAAMIVGFIVNRFRGDPTLFDDGMKAVSERTGWRALGLVPFFEAAHRLPAEDAVILQDQKVARGDGRIRIAVLVYPRIANFDDFDPLRLDPGVDLVFVGPHQPVPGDTRLIILPGSKSTIADLASLRQFGWDIDLKAHLRRGGFVLGICGGYQMLGRTIADPHGIEGPPQKIDGLGLFEVDTVLEGDKVLVEVSGETADGAVPFKGYEMHIGRTTSGDGSLRPLLSLGHGKTDGAVSVDGRVAGCYIHGLLADDRQRQHWLKLIGGRAAGFDYEADVDATLDLLADHLEKHVDCDRLLALAREPKVGG